MRAQQAGDGRACKGCGDSATPTKGQTYRYLGVYWHPSCKAKSEKQKNPTARRRKEA